MIQSSVRGKLAPMKKGPVNPSSIGTPGYSNEILIDGESRKANTKLRDTCSGNPYLEAYRGEGKAAEKDICLESARKCLRLTSVLKSKT